MPVPLANHPDWQLDLYHKPSELERRCVLRLGSEQMLEQLLVAEGGPCDEAAAGYRKKLVP
jgi:hypothetical protein